ncbi:Squidulin (Optic lobe calcium-binding protein) (SCABP) [Durusdinium trenchii]|uniref:Squidulin (Optic lobe calcium-binding protein) (SCABP) n=1 Tax=Durusdinium trenchii TaxID=1381693 RepID=A0ABP0PMH6_9DINO
MEETLKFTICHVPEMILAKDLCGTSVDVQHHGRGVLLEGWGDYDAQTRYKHLSGQKEQSFRALTDAQRAAQPREELCPTVLQVLRERVAFTMQKQSFMSPVPFHVGQLVTIGLFTTWSQATYVREYVAPLHPAPPMQVTGHGPLPKGCSAGGCRWMTGYEPYPYTGNLRSCCIDEKLAGGWLRYKKRKGAVAGLLQFAERVKKAPQKMDSKKAFEIPGLQARPYHDDELQAVAFEIIDLDRHGEIGATDLRRALQLLGCTLCGEPEPTDAEIQEMIRLMDPDGSGSIEFAEFRRYFVEPPPLFRNFDLHRRGGFGEAPDEEEEEEPPPPDTLALVDGGDATPALARLESRKKKFTLKEHAEGDPRAPYVKELAKHGITPEFIRDVYQTFVEIDTKDTGFMSFEAFCKVFSKKPSPEMREIFDAFDADREGEPGLDLRQFVIGLSTKVNDILQMRATLKCHQELQKLGQLYEYQPSFLTIFVSHQTQEDRRRLQEAYVPGQMLPSSSLRVWFDWFSVPQASFEHDPEVKEEVRRTGESVTLYSDLVLAVAFAKMSSFAFLKDFFPKMYRDTGSGEGFGHERTGRLKPRPSSTSFLSKVNSSLCGCMSDVCSLGAEFAE